MYTSSKIFQVKIIKIIEKISSDEGIVKDEAVSRLDRRRIQNNWTLDRLQKELGKRPGLDIMQGLSLYGITLNIV